MTGFLTTYDGSLWQLPPLLAWEILRTDGDGCDSATVRFVYEPKRLSVLQAGARLRLEEDGVTRFFGVVDECTVNCGEGGRLVTLSCRSLQALLTDNELRAARFSVITLADALEQFVVPFGITRIAPAELPDVPQFAVETGNTAWQALRGFCRHSGGAMPRFAADGTLIFGAEAGKTVDLGGCAVKSAELRRCVYGLIGRQIIVSSGYEDVELAQEDAVLARGGCQKVSMRVGRTLKADWRTARQRVQESKKEELALTLTLAGDVSALPGDTAALSLDGFGIRGRFLIRRVKTELSAGGRQTILTMEGGAQDVAV